MLSSTDGLGRTTNYAYDGAGRLTQQTDPADANGVRRVTYLSYGGSFTAPTVVRLCGLGTTCGTSAEIRTEYSYFGASPLPMSETRVDAAAGTSIATSYNYDTAGRLLSADGPLSGTGDARYFRYDVVGRKIWEIGPADASGVRFATRTTWRDADDKVVAVETGSIPDATSTTLTVFMRADTSYDTRRNPVRVAASAGGATYKVQNASFDDRGQQLCSTVRMNAAVFASLPADACALGTQGSDGPDRITHNVYDAAGQLTQVQRAYLTPLQQNYATYGYSLNGKQSSMTDANGNLAGLAYDGFDRLLKWSFPSKTVAGQASATDYESYTYDAAGNRTSVRKRDGVTLTYQYDNLDRVIVKSVPASASGAAGYSVYYGYDVRGLQLYARFGSASGQGVDTAYDGYGRPTSSTTTMGGVTRILGYGYDAAGNRTQIVHPDGQILTMTYDAASRLVSAHEPDTGLQVATYDDLGRQTRRVGVETLGYDPIGRLSSITGAYVAYGLQLSYNAASQITGRTQTNDAYSYTGDVSVNRTYGVNGLNQYTTAGPATFSYDANGNLTGDGSTTYVYDAENRLVSASNGAALSYDPLGRLWQTSGPSTGVTQLVYDGDRLTLEYSGSGTVLRRYLHGAGADDPLFWYEGASVNIAVLRAEIVDERGSVIAAMNNQGTILGLNSYDAWGIPGAGNIGRFQYTGQAWVPELGLYYYKARMYSPALGRFMQTDPIGYADQNNLYAYVGNDPVDGDDATGLCTGSLIENKDGSCAGSTLTGAGAVNPSLSGAGSVEGALPHGREPSQAKSGDGGSSGSSSSSAGSSSIASTPQSPQGNQAGHYQFEPLSATDRAKLDAAMNTGGVVRAMRQAWRNTLLTGDEFSFFIYNGQHGYYPGAVYRGGATYSSPLEYYEYIDRDIDPVFNYHTHPGSYPASAYPSWQDLRFDQRTRTIGILQTRFGFSFGH